MSAIKRFIVTWHSNKTPSLVRHTEIKCMNAHDATGIFMNEMGNLKKNTILKIQETGPNGEQIGEPIVPDEH